MRPTCPLGALLLGLALASAAPAARGQTPPPSSSAASATVRARLQGTYVLLRGESAVGTRDAAIDSSVESLFFAARPIARHLLRDRCRIDTAITLRIADGVIRASTPENTVVVSREDGSWSTYKYGSEVFQLAQKLTPAGLVQTFVGPDGTRRNDFTLSDDGTTLTLHVNLMGPQLPRPVAYVLEYKRVTELGFRE